LDTISGALDAETSNGRISVRDARGSVTLKSSFGAIEASNVPKGIRAITGNGASRSQTSAETHSPRPVSEASLRNGINGNLTVENTNGSVTARNVKGDTGVRTSFAGVTLESIGGRITVDNQKRCHFGDGSATGKRLPRHFAQDLLLIHPRARSGRHRLQPHSENLVRPDFLGIPITSTGSIGGDSLSGTIGQAAASFNSRIPMEASRSPKRLDRFSYYFAARRARSIANAFFTTRVAVFRQVKSREFLLARECHVGYVTPSFGLAADSLTKVIRNDEVKSRSWFRRCFSRSIAEVNPVEHFNQLENSNLDSRFFP